MLSRFHPIPGRYIRTDRTALSIWRVSVLTRDKNYTREKGGRASRTPSWIRHAMTTTYILQEAQLSLS